MVLRASGWSKYSYSLIGPDYDSSRSKACFEQEKENLENCKYSNAVNEMKEKLWLITCYFSLCCCCCSFPMYTSVLICMSMLLHKASVSCMMGSWL